MANINVKKRLDNIEDELEKVKKHVHMYSGIPREHAAHIGRVTARIAQIAVALENLAERTLMGGKR